MSKELFKSFHKTYILWKTIVSGKNNLFFSFILYTIIHLGYLSARFIIHLGYLSARFIMHLGYLSARFIIHLGYLSEKNIYKNSSHNTVKGSHNPY